ncbi:hypothetical protein U9M48_006233 [Paspalum notatum var. saurae]|uniref:Reverse transcriptase Ty1/copia-type domain-containing protein n=1 Tax=Paspalum notatum var. saurae TaxID=547442 RepID=A0AAQ3SM55_PASNO
MDVTFRESEPYYGEKTDLSSLFELDDPSMDTDDQEGVEDIEDLHEKEDNQSRETEAITGLIPLHASNSNGNERQENRNIDNMNARREQTIVHVYTRRKKTTEIEQPLQVEQQVEQSPQVGQQVEDPQIDNMNARQEQSIVRGDSRRKKTAQGEQSQQVEQQVEQPQQVEQQQSSTSDVKIDDNEVGWSIETGGEEVDSSISLPIALRKEARSRAGKPRIRYGFEPDISNYVSYESLSPAYRAFVASLQSVSIPRDWKEAKQDPKWKEAMLEELAALEKNKTWDLVPFPVGKKVVNCKWVYTIKQNPNGKIERYKARLVAKGYSQTYGIDYDETFAPVAKMSTVRTLISCVANFSWPLYQLDVKNAFLHGDLQEKVYMEIPPGFATAQTKGKVLRLKKSLYGLKQSPRAWFDRFRRAMYGMGYKQLYVDDIIIIGDDTLEIERLKKNLSKEFEVKDLGQLRYFLGIEIARSPKGIVLSQRKYVLDLLNETDWASCLDDRRSTSGYCTFVGGNLVSWRSKKQPVVSRSTAEAEYRAMSVCLSEMLWVKNLLSELKLWKGSLRLWCDNKSAINIANNPVQHDRTKHVEIDRFFIKERLDDGTLKLYHIASVEQLADCLTKGLGAKECVSACNKMGMIDIYRPF